MAEEAILEYVKSIDQNLKALNLAVTKNMTDHQNDDNERHDIIDKKLQSLDKFRLITIIWTLGVLLGGGAVGTKLGMLDKLISLLGGS